MNWTPMDLSRTRKLTLTIDLVTGENAETGWIRDDAIRVSWKRMTNEKSQVGGRRFIYCLSLRLMDRMSNVGECGVVERCACGLWVCRF